MSNCRQWGDAEEDWKISRIFEKTDILTFGKELLSEEGDIWASLTPPLSASSWLDTTPSQNGDYYVKVQLIIEKIFITSSLRGCEFATIITNTEW